MKKLIAVSTLAVTFPINQALFAEYAGEVSLGYENLDTDISSVDMYLVGATVFFQPLSYVGKTPYDEAAFFNQVGSVDLLYGRATGFGEDFDAYGIALVGQSSRSPHGFTASWFQSEVLDDFDTYQAGYHYYLDEGFTVGADVSRIDLGIDHAWAYDFSSKRLFSFQRNRWLAIDGGFGWTDDGHQGDWNLNGTATYYPTERSGVGIGFVTTDRFADYDTEFSVTHYLKKNLAVNASYNRSFIKNDRDSDGISLGAKLRF